jgi:internalin A
MLNLLLHTLCNPFILWVVVGEKQNMCEQEAKKRISECAETKSTHLDLSELKLSTFPQELGQLTHLISMNYSSNHLESLAGIEVLSQLTALDCGGNQLNSLAGIEALTQLTELDSSGNRLSNLAGIETLTQLTKLDCSCNLLNSLTGIEALTQVTEFDCSGNQLNSLTGIEAATQLIKLDCSANELISLTGIDAATQLIKLGCRGNQLNSLTGIEALTQLTELDCNDNQLNSLTGLEAATQLTELDCSDNQLNSLAGLEAATQLIKLRCSGNQLSSLTGIEAATRLTELDCNDNQLNSLTGIETATRLTGLDCRNNQLSSLTGIEAFTQLTELYCNGNQLSSLTGIEAATQLTELYCNNNQLTCLTGIEALTQLIELDCSNNQLNRLVGVESLTRLIVLYCNGNQLSSLTGIEALTRLTKLDCSDNQLNSLTGFEALTGLIVLYCNDNQLSSLDGLEALTQLTELDCGNNQLNSLTGLEALTQLTVLYCGDNQLNNLAGLEVLTQLTELDCRGNQLNNLAGLEALTQLTVLRCSSNQLNSLAGIETLSSLLELDAGSNPVKHIPHAFLDKISALRAYWQEINDSGALINNRHKLLLLGNGRVGKTTLANALIDKVPQDNEESCQSTIGITLRNWSISAQDGYDWQIRIWDFGGQELYHATHRLFQSQSGIYCALWAEETDEETDEYQHSLRYWLDLIADNNTDSPVIIVKNQIDRSNKQGLNNVALQGEPYCQLAHIPISALQYKNVDTLVSAILEKLHEQRNLQTRLPKSWGKVRRELEEQGGTLSKQEFDNLCSDCEVLHAETLLSYLNQCGDVFYRDNHFSQTIFVDQNWALNAVYRLFETSQVYGNPRQMIDAHSGQVNGAELIQIFGEYELSDVRLFTEFMLQSQMLFCMSEDDCPFDERAYVVPALLPKQPQSIIHPVDTASFQYRLSYPWMHRLAIERLIVECSHLSREQVWWRNGIRLSFDGKITCDVCADAKNAHLTLAFWGNHSDIKTTLPRIIKTIERTKIASAIDEQMWFQGEGWCKKEDITKYAKLSRFVLDAEGQKRDGLSYYAMLDIDCEEIISAEPTAPFVYLNIENINMTTDNSRTITNSPGAIAGDINHSTVTVCIGETQEQRAFQLDDITELIEQLQSSELPDKEIHINQLATAQQELAEEQPDEGYIEKSLKRFSKIVDKLESSQQLYTHVITFLAGFGIVI